jgi:hypothetical protein
VSNKRAPASPSPIPRAPVSITFIPFGSVTGDFLREAPLSSGPAVCLEDENIAPRRNKVRRNGVPPQAYLAN